VTGFALYRYTHPEGCAKEAKGYGYVGQFRIDTAGRPLPLLPEVDTSPATAGPAERQAPAIDLARLQSGGEDFWF
jgi:hypothetical protein